MNLQKPLIASPRWTVEEEGQLRSQVVQGQTALEIGVKARKIHAAGRAGAEGETEVKGSKWPGKLKFQIWIIVALVFIIWIILQNPARWG